MSEKSSPYCRCRRCRILVYRLLNPLGFAQVSWLVFKARAKCRYLDHNGRASNAEKQPTGRRPEGCVENGSAASLLVSHVQHQFDVSPRKPTRYLQTSNWCWMLLPHASQTTPFECNKAATCSGISGRVRRRPSSSGRIESTSIACIGATKPGTGAVGILAETLETPID